jgi:hypothetical protein
LRFHVLRNFIVVILSFLLSFMVKITGNHPAIRFLQAFLLMLVAAVARGEGIREVRIPSPSR